MIMRGKDRGKTGTVARAFPADGQVIVDGVNMKKKHAKPVQGGQGQLIEAPAPIDVSNVMIIDPKSKKPTRVVKKKVGDKYVRAAAASGQEV